MIRPSLRRTAAVLIASLGVACAQQPLLSPIYYVTTAPALLEGDPLRGELTAESGQNFKDGSRLDVLVLRGVAGEGVEIRVASDDFDTFLSVFTPEGTLLEANDDDWNADAAYASLLRLELPSTGTYLVVVSGYWENDRGRYTVTRSAYEPPEPIRTDVTAPGRFEGDLAEESANVYVIDLTEPTTLTATLRSNSFDAYLEVVDTDLGWVGANDDFDGTDAQVVVDLVPGTYDVEVSAYFDTGSGPYTLDLAW